MDCKKTGSLILQLRKERGLTQKEVADALHLSDKTISKWERGAGCPDVSLLGEVASLFGITVENLLSGGLEDSEPNGGNMKRIKFYVCRECGNVITATGEVELSCCGRKLEPEKPQKEAEGHGLVIKGIEDEYLVSLDHEMKKEHYVSFIAWVNWERVNLVKLYPEQSAEVRFPGRRGGTYYYYCTEHGLFSH